MRIQVESAREAELLCARWGALKAALGPEVEAHATLPDGRRLAKFCGGNSPAAQVRSLIEKIEDYLSHQTDQGTP